MILGIEIAFDSSPRRDNSGRDGDRALRVENKNKRGRGPEDNGEKEF